jgi:very-short-patch-repair endonuclease
MGDGVNKAEIILRPRIRSKKINGYNIIRLPDFEVTADLDSCIKKIKTFISTTLSPSQGDLRGS